MALGSDAAGKNFRHSEFRIQEQTDCSRGGVAFRKHADYRDTFSIERQSTSNNSGVTAESRLPISICENCYARRAGLAIRFVEISSLHSGDTEQFKILRRDYAASQSFGRTLAGERKIQRTIRGDLRKRVIVIAIGDEFRRGKRRGGEFRLHIFKPNNLLWIWIRQRTKQNSVDDAEDCGVCADTESQRENRDDGESGILRETAYAVAHVLGETFQPAENVHVARPFFLQSEIPKTSLRVFVGFAR